MGSRLRLLEATEDSSGHGGWTEVRASRPRCPGTALAAAGMLLLAAALLWASALHRARTEVALVHVTVAPGDTLWNLARQHCGPSEYLPKAVHSIRQANGLSTSRLMPGQHLVIPVQVPTPVRTPACMSLARVGTP